MIKKRISFLLVFIGSFLFGVVSVQFLTLYSSPVALDTADLVQEIPLANLPEPSIDLEADLCSQDDQSALLKLLVEQWVSGGNIENVAYCLRPELIDLNEDGTDELAVRYFCSPTGNCSMKVYQRTGRSYREIFSDRQMVSYFEKRGGKHNNFRDLQTRSHGSCCDGDQVIYRFNGRFFKPLSCSEYSYWHLAHSGQNDGEPKITRRSCKQSLDSLP